MMSPPDFGVWKVLAYSSLVSYVVHIGGSPGWIRTNNLLIQNQTGYQLPHGGVELVRFELTTRGLRVRCSDQLSYSSKCLGVA